MRFPLATPEALADEPELAPLEILASAVEVSRRALLAAHPELEVRAFIGANPEISPRECIAASILAALDALNETVAHYIAHLDTLARTSTSRGDDDNLPF